MDQCLEEKLDSALDPQFFQAIENLILLVSADKQSTDNLNSLAALLSIPFLPPQGWVWLVEVGFGCYGLCWGLFDLVELRLSDLVG